MRTSFKIKIIHCLVELDKIKTEDFFKNGRVCWGFRGLPSPIHSFIRSFVHSFRNCLDLAPSMILALAPSTPGGTKV